MYRSTRLPILRHFQAAQRTRQSKARHDRMVALVERMLQLNKRKHVAPPSRRQRGRQDAGATTDLEREIASTDAEIDNLVYELYGITGEERKIIERNL